MKSITLLSGILDSALPFELPPELEASEPPEARGLARDEVRLMVSHYSDDRVQHAQFRDLPSFIEPGDLLVINTSATLNAALPAMRADGSQCELHLSTHLPDDRWTVEIRTRFEAGSAPLYDAYAGETLQLPAGVIVTLIAPYLRNNDTHTSLQTGTELAPLCAQSKGHSRLWLARLSLPGDLHDVHDVHDYLARYGSPIRYRYVPKSWPLSYYQTAYATQPGSAEMPSAGRAFTPELLTRLVAQGVIIAPLLLHTGVASLEEHEPPYAEYYRVSPETARQVDLAREAGKRVIAVGTTVVRALESVTDAQGITHPGEGWTELVITPQRGIRAINAILTGLHEPRASHLAMLEALAGRAHLSITYAEALRERYLWHEFGDLHLIVP
ncbi:MAG TPA: S-adenosylmethionine:tRNA ribosyltransferase-isomerase [Ktedonobacteraceae bacterium]|nr:S-adenosylmethionine:tRNA ribosyltransferase-isomerase [Ktedonobacteraceae bacterium]